MRDLRITSSVNWRKGRGIKKREVGRPKAKYTVSIAVLAR